MPEQRLIDANELLKRIEINDVGARALIENAPTIAPRHDWVRCSERLPTKTAFCKVTAKVSSEMGTWRETKIIPYRYCDGVGEWILPKSDWLIYGVIAWTKADEPYQGEA